MRIQVLTLAALLALDIGAASAESFNGKWEASGPAVVGRKCPAYDAHIVVRGSAITIRLGGGRKSFVLKGQVAPDGSFAAEGLNGETSATGKFAGNVVELTLVASCGARPGTGHRDLRRLNKRPRISAGASPRGGG
jgi:hypothetical protein